MEAGEAMTIADGAQMGSETAALAVEVRARTVMLQLLLRCADRPLDPAPLLDAVLTQRSLLDGASAALAVTDGLRSCG